MSSVLLTFCKILYSFPRLVFLMVWGEWMGPEEPLTQTQTTWYGFRVLGMERSSKYLERKEKIQVAYKAVD